MNKINQLHIDEAQTRMVEVRRLCLEVKQHLDKIVSEDTNTFLKKSKDWVKDTDYHAEEVINLLNEFKEFEE